MNAFLFSALLTPDVTPKATVQAFVDALRAHDASAARRVVGGKSIGIPLVAGMPTVRVALGEERIEGDTATVEVDANVEFRTRPVRMVHETVGLHRIDGNWRIVPAPESDFTQRKVSGYGPRLVAEWALLVTDGAMMDQARQAAYATQGLINSKNIALAAIMYSADHGDRLPNAANFRPAIAPYLKRMLGPHPTSPDPFVAPGTPKGTTYFLDPRLSGRSITSIDRISEVALIVMGKDGRATYPYRGQTVVSYTDGHVKRVRPDAVYKARTIPLG